MIEITVFFEFEENKDEWIVFAEKFEKWLNEKGVKSNSLERLIEKFGSLKNWVDFCFNNSDADFWVAVYAICLTTRSRKTLSKLNEWIKENHYESKYYLRNKNGSRMGMDLDELFEWSDERKKRNQI